MTFLNRLNVGGIVLDGYRELVLSDGAGLFLPLEETSGTTFEDIAAGGNDGTSSGTVTASALHADFGGGYIEIGSNAITTNPSSVSDTTTTLELWVRLDSAGGQWIAYAGSATDFAFALSHDATSGFNWFVLTAAGASCYQVNVNSPANTGEWYHLWCESTRLGVSNYDGRLFVNNVEATNVVVNAAFSANIAATSFRIGDGWGSSAPLDGQVRWVAVYNAPAFADGVRTNHYELGKGA